MGRSQWNNDFSGTILLEQWMVFVKNRLPYGSKMGRTKNIPQSLYVSDKDGILSVKEII